MAFPLDKDGLDRLWISDVFPFGVNVGLLEIVPHPLDVTKIKILGDTKTDYSHRRELFGRIRDLLPCSCLSLFVPHLGYDRCSLLKFIYLGFLLFRLSG